MKWIKRLAYFLGIVYILACIALFFIQDKILFRPHALPESHTFRTGEEVEIPVSDDISLNCLWMKEPASKGVILYLHGNRGSIRRCIYQTRNMTGHQYDIFMPDYRGYGKSEGKNYSEKQLHADIQEVYNFLKQHYSEDQIVVLGYSLGSGIATRLASNNNPQQLFLVAPYLSMTDLKDRLIPFVPDFILKFPLRTEDIIGELKMPITLFHGTNDNVIPYDSSEKLKVINADNIQLITQDGESHRGSIFHHSVRQTLSRLLR